MKTMKRIILLASLILLSISSYSQTIINAPNEGTKIDSILGVTAGRDAVHIPLSTLKNWIGVGGTLSTGIKTGGVVTIASATTINISAGTGFIEDWTDPANPTFTDYSWPESLGVAIPDMALAFTNIWMVPSASPGIAEPLLESGGTVTPNKRRICIALQSALHLDGITITVIANSSTPAYETVQALLDYVYKLGTINEGNNYSENGANLGIDKTSGLSVLPFINRSNSLTNPTEETNLSGTAITLIREYRDGLGEFTIEIDTDVNPDFWDDGTGTLNTVSNNQYTIQRFYYFGQTNATITTYGQAEYSSLAIAEGEIFREAPILDPILAGGVFTTALIIQEGVTNLTTAISGGDAKFVNIESAFSSSGGGVSGNFVTADTDQITGLTGDKTWDGNHIFQNDVNINADNQLNLSNDTDGFNSFHSDESNSFGFGIASLIYRGGGSGHHFLDGDGDTYGNIFSNSSKFFESVLLENNLDKSITAQNVGATTGSSLHTNGNLFAYDGSSVFGVYPRLGGETVPTIIVSNDALGDTEFHFGDSSNNNIINFQDTGTTETVAFMSDLPTSSNFVDLTTNQTVAGEKTFSDKVYLNSPLILNGAPWGIRTENFGNSVKLPIYFRQSDDFSTTTPVVINADGVMEFDSGATWVSLPVNDEDLANKLYVDNSIPTIEDFLRADIEDHKTNGALILDDDVHLRLGIGNDVRMYHNNSTGNNFMDLYNGDFVIRATSSPRFTFERSVGDFTATGDIISNGGIVLSDSYLRSDAATIKTSGALTLNDNIDLSFGTSGVDSAIRSNGTNTIWNLKSGNFSFLDNGINRFTFDRTSGDFTATGKGTFGDDISLTTNGAYLQADLASSAQTRIHGINASDLEYIGSIDQTVTGTFVGNNTGYVSLRSASVERLRINSTNADFDVPINAPSIAIDGGTDLNVLLDGGGTKLLTDFNNGVDGITHQQIPFGAIGGGVEGSNELLWDGDVFQIQDDVSSNSLQITTETIKHIHPVNAARTTLFFEEPVVWSTVTIRNKTGTIALTSDLLPLETTAVAVDLTVAGNYVSMSSANTALAYTTTNDGAGSWAKILINAASQPTVDGGSSPTSGATFATSTNMYLVIWNNGNVTEHYYLEI